MKTKLLLLSFTLFVLWQSKAQWTVQNTGFATASRGIRNISIVDENIVWAIAYDGSGTAANVQEFTKTTNGGTTWTTGSINVGNTGSGIAMIHAISATKAWVAVYPNAGGQPQGVFVTTNGGTTWTKQTTASFSGAEAFANVVHFWDENNGVCMGDPNGGYFEIYTTTNGGTNWTRVPSANIAAPLSGEYGYVGQIFVSSDPNTVWFTTNKGRIYRSSNRGLNWVAFQSPLSDFGGEGQSGEIAFKDANNGYLIDNSGLYWTSIDGGANFEMQFASEGTTFGGDICVVPNTNIVVTTTANQDAPGSSYSLDGFQLDPVFVDVDAIQHLDVKFLNATTGWSGGFNQSATVGGMFKWNSNVLLKVSDELAAKGLVVYPNPVQSTLYLNAIENIDNVQIFNTVGQLLLQVKPSNISTSVDLSNLASGTYIAKISIGTAEGSVKIVK